MSSFVHPPGVFSWPRPSGSSHLIRSLAGIRRPRFLPGPTSSAYPGLHRLLPPPSHPLDRLLPQLLSSPSPLAPTPSSPRLTLHQLPSHVDRHRPSSSPTASSSIVPRRHPTYSPRIILNHYPQSIHSNFQVLVKNINRYIDIRRSSYNIYIYPSIYLYIFPNLIIFLLPSFLHLCPGRLSNRKK